MQFVHAACKYNYRPIHSDELTAGDLVFKTTTNSYKHISCEFARLIRWHTCVVFCCILRTSRPGFAKKYLEKNTYPDLKRPKSFPHFCCWVCVNVNPKPTPNLSWRTRSRQGRGKARQKNAAQNKITHTTKQTRGRLTHHECPAPVPRNELIRIPALHL